MKKSRYLQAALIVGLTLIMTGCGEKFPDLTEEQYKQTVEYAAGLLMKYSNNGQERLVVVDVKEVSDKHLAEIYERLDMILSDFDVAGESRKNIADYVLHEGNIEKV